MKTDKLTNREGRETSETNEAIKKKAGTTQSQEVESKT